MEIVWPWRNLGELALLSKRGTYIGFFRKPYWGIFIHNPERRYGAWSCRWCRHRVLCLPRERCIAPRTSIILGNLAIHVGDNEWI